MATAADVSAVRGRLDRLKARVRAACERVNRDPAGVRVIAVTKYGPESFVEALVKAGHRDLAENRVQQLVPRAQASRQTAASVDPPVWHMIGTLQRNKVRQLVGHVSFIHSVDTLELIHEIDKRWLAARPLAPVQVLLEVNISGEQSKSGFAAKDVEAAVVACATCKGLQVVGLMTMAPQAEPPDLRATVEPVFAELAHLRGRLATQLSLPTLTELSMGMTADFEIAIEHGATMIRVGSALMHD